MGPRLQELLQKFRLVKEDSAIGEVWICWVSDTRKGFCVIVWKYQPLMSCCGCIGRAGLELEQSLSLTGLCGFSQCLNKGCSAPGLPETYEI